MNRRILLKAAGAYAEEVARHLGLLTLKAAVLAGLRIRDGIKYSPDERLIPKNADSLYDQLRDGWNEYEALGHGIGAFLEDRIQMEVRLMAMLEVKEWSDPLPLAYVAHTLLDRDPLSGITLAAACLRLNRIKESVAALKGLDALRCTFKGDLISRYYRNWACLLESLGDIRSAARFAGLAVESYPACPVAQVDYLAYSKKVEEEQ